MPITDLGTIIPASQIDPVMTTDAEADNKITAAINAHVAETDPHSQYLLPSEGDARYRQTTTALYTAQPLPTANLAGNSIAFSWNSVQPGNGIGELCNYAGLGGGDAFNFFRMPGNAVSVPTISHRVSRIDIGGGYIQTSDKRVKTDFSPAPGLAAILALTPLRYKHWECLGIDDKKAKLGTHFVEKIGFLAQDVQKIIPEAVPATKSDEELHGIDVSQLVAVLVRGVQELEAEVRELRSQIAAIPKK